MTAFEMAQRFVGEIQELPGGQHNPAIQWFHMLCGLGGDQGDEVPWCSSFANAVCWLLRLPRSKSAAARSWLTIGRPVTLEAAKVGYDVVVLQRGAGEQPGADVLQAPGHVGFFAGLGANEVFVLAGNQSNAVTVQAFRRAQVLGVRRLVEGNA